MSYKDVSAEDVIGIAMATAVDFLAFHASQASDRWWRDPRTNEPIKRNTGELLMLCVSELSEAMEGDRKDLQDDKLPQYKMFDVELIDCAIRLFDLIGHLVPNAGEIFVNKMYYNKSRVDHTHEHRLGDHGKKY